EMERCSDPRLAGEAETEHDDRVDLFVRTSTKPEPDLELHQGRWTSDEWPSPSVSWHTRPLAGPRELVVDPDVGTAAWIDCAGHLPWGLSVDQREDDARSLVWEWPGRYEKVVGHPHARVRLSVGAPPASPRAHTRRRAAPLSLGEAVRRLPRRHLGPGHARQPRPHLPGRCARTGH